MEFVEIQFFSKSNDCQTQVCQNYELSQQQFSLQDKMIQCENHQNSIQTQQLANQNNEASHFNSKKSTLHNMQKHLFTFIQSLIAQKNQIQENDESQIALCYQLLLSQLKSQKKKTRQSLLPVFGSIDWKNIHYKKYVNLFNSYSFQTLRNAQQMAKQNILRQMTVERIEKYLEKSKITKKTEFQEYIKVFIQEVMEGNFSSRISKKFQKQIKDETNWVQFIDLN